MFYFVLGFLLLVGGFSAYADGLVSEEMAAIGLFTSVYIAAMAFLFRD